MQPFVRYLDLVRSAGIDRSTYAGRSRDRYRRVAWSAVTSGAARVIAVGTGLVTVPLTLQYLGAERFGLWMTIVAATLILQFADFGIGNGLLNKLAEANGCDDRRYMRILVGSGMAALSGIALIIVVAFILATRIVSWSTVFNARTPVSISESTPSVAVLIVVSALNMALSPILRVNMALQEDYINGLWQVIGNVVGLVALIVAIQIGAGLPVLLTCYMLGPIVSTVANGFLLFFYRHPWIRPTLADIRWADAWKISKLGFWFLVTQVATSLNSVIPTLVISNILGLEYVAVFSIALRLASIALIMQYAILTPLWPAYAEAAKRGDWAWVVKTVKRSILLSASIGTVMSFIMIGLGPTIIRAWVGTNAVPPEGVLLGLAAWVISSSINGPLAMLLNGLGQIKTQALAGVVFSIFMLVSCIWFTKYFNLPGAAWAFGITYTLPSIIVAGIIARRHLEKNWIRLDSI